MTNYEIQPVTERELTEVAQFLSPWWNEHRAALNRMEPAEIGKHLKWRLADNPAARGDPQIGYCARNKNGRIVGTILFIPGEFRLDRRKLTGLCGSSLVVEPPPRMLGFFLFHRFLRTPGYDFCFGTTNNIKAGALWKKLGGHAVTESQYEYLLPFRLGSLLECAAESRNWSRFAASVLRVAGSRMMPLLWYKRNGHSLSVKPCHDWDRLAYLAEMHRNPGVLTAERSGEVLQWRYESSPSCSAKEIYSFRSRTGAEGWFSLCETRRGKGRQFHAMMLMDLVWPRRRVDLAEILSAIADCCAGCADALVVPGREQISSELGRFRMIRRKFPEPRGYVLASDGSGEALAGVADFVGSDGDTAE